jgi:UrcA family protein
LSAFRNPSRKTEKGFRTKTALRRKPVLKSHRATAPCGEILHPALIIEEITMKTTIQAKLTAAIYLAYGAATLSALQSSAAGAAEESPPTRTVHFADLDISKPSGVRTLYRRIEAAAHEVCRLPLESDRHTLGLEQACIQHAVDDAVKKVNSVALAEMHSKTLLPRLASR